MEKTEKTEKRGGVREGSGRKKKEEHEKKQTISLVLDPQIVNWIKLSGGSKFINNILKKIIEEANNLK